MLVKIHASYRIVIAICDKEILGKEFREGRKILNIKENFYRGEEKDEKQMVEIMQDYAKEDATFNIVGKKISFLRTKRRNSKERRCP